MKTILMSSAVVLSMASLATTAEEMSTSFSWGDVTFQPRAYVGYADYKLDSGVFTFTEGDSLPLSGHLNFDHDNHDKIEFSGLIGGIGGTVGYGQFFGDFYYQSTLNEVAYSGYSTQERLVDEQTGETQLDFNYNRGDVKAQHADWALSLGYLITDRWAVFAGYKSGNTDWDQPIQLIAISPISGLIENAKISGKFDQDGPFLGTSYSFPIGPGALTLKAAYAYLDGAYKWSFNDYSLIDDMSQSVYLNLDGHSNAFSIGVSWTQSLTDNLGYSIGANYHQYRFDMSGTSTATEQNTGELNQDVTGGSLTEDLFTLTASLLYRF
ncbi:MAG: hypothetical protein KDJ70_04835 [Candidatus Competibacteraceae bacterium]|nr:hypothetical protein [Candidatus Competibacteraceae bacterium]